MDHVWLRPFAPADARRVAAVLNADAALIRGGRRAVLDGAGNVRMNRYVPPASHQIVALGAAGEIVGYAYLANRDQGVIWETGGAVHPDWHGRGVADRLLAWAEREAAAQADYAPVGVKMVLQINLFPEEERAIRLVERRAYARVREWLHFQCMLGAPPPAPELPGNLVLRPMDLDNDWDLAEPAMEAAYADHWGTIAVPLTPANEPPPAPEIAQDASFSNAPGYCFLVLAGPQCVGGIFCNARLAERDDSGRIGSLFVHPGYRRRGIGRALMLAGFNAFWQGGIRRVILDTDATSLTSAPAFYRSLGMDVYRREWLYEKQIRPGQEVRRR